jgi:putative transposase
LVNETRQILLTESETLQTTIDCLIQHIPLETQDRQRFGIETSYRIKNICRLKTTNKKPVIRLLFIGISFLLVNIWINLLWRKVCFPRRGGRLIYRELFTFQQMLSFLRQAVDKIYQVVDTIYLPSG